MAGFVIRIACKRNRNRAEIPRLKAKAIPAPNSGQRSCRRSDETGHPRDVTHSSPLRRGARHRHAYRKIRGRNRSQPPFPVRRSSPGGFPSSSVRWAVPPIATPVDASGKPAVIERAAREIGALYVWVCLIDLTNPLRW